MAKDRHNELIEATIIVQKFMKGYQIRMRIHKLRKLRHNSAKIIQSRYRTFSARKTYLSLLDSAKVIQKNFRMFVARKGYEAVLEGAKKI